MCTLPWSYTLSSNQFCHLTPSSLLTLPGVSPSTTGGATSLRCLPPVIHSQGSPLTSWAGSSPAGGVASSIYSVRSLFCPKPSITVSYSSVPHYHCTSTTNSRKLSVNCQPSTLSTLFHQTVNCRSVNRRHAPSTARTSKSTILLMVLHMATGLFWLGYGIVCFPSNMLPIVIENTAAIPETIIIQLICCYIQPCYSFRIPT